MKLGIRTKLTLTTVAVLAVVYLALGALVQFAVGRAILSAVDTDLRISADREVQRHIHVPPFPGPPPPGGFAREGFIGGGFAGGFSQGPGEVRFGAGGGPDPGPVFLSEPPQPGAPPQIVRGVGPPPGAAPNDPHPPVVVWHRTDVRFPFPPHSPYDPSAIESGMRGRRVFATVSFDGEPVRVLTAPIPSPDRRTDIDAVLQFSYPMGDIQKTLLSLGRTLFLILPVGLALVASASLFVVGRAMRPIRDINATAAKIEAESLSGRLKADGSDEFAELARTINGMLGRLEDSFAQKEAVLQKLLVSIEQQRRFTADASHELKTPLAVIKAHSGLLQGKNGDAETQESIEAIDTAADRMAGLVRDLLLLARMDAGQLGDSFVLCDFNEIVEQAALAFPTRRKIDVKRADQPLHVCGAPPALERVISNLLDNANRHTPDGDEIGVTLRAENGRAIADVWDTGEGIPPEHLPKIFDRFYRVDSSRYSGSGGTGLGLAICKGIVEAHHGTISVRSHLGQGTCFCIALPTVK